MVGEVETKNIEVNIKKSFNLLDDEEMLRKKSNIDVLAKENRYHGFRRTEHQVKAKKTPKEIEEEMN